MVTVKKRSRWTMPVVAMVFVFAVVMQLLTPVLAYAKTVDDIHDMNYKYYAARYLRDCLAGLDSRLKNSIQLAAMNEGTWLTGGDRKVITGYIFEPTDGLAGCEETGLVKTAMMSLGYEKDPGKLLTDIGYTKQGATFIRPPGGDTMNITIVDKLQQTNYALYVYYQKLFVDKCNLVEPPTGNGETITVNKAVLGDDGNWSVKPVQMQWKDAGMHGKVNNSDYRVSEVSCDNLLKFLSDVLVNSVVAYNNIHKNDPITDQDKDSGGGKGTDCTENPDAEGCGEDAPTCTDQIKGIGWLICPTMDFLGNMLEASYGALASSFLQVDTSLVKGAEAPWAKFKDLANVAFVIALLMVIYSQLTSVGISNYGIKKMLPKIIVAALLVNLSYFICQIAVDLSNIAGFSISKFFTGIQIGGDPTDTNSDKVLQGLGLGISITAALGAILVGGIGLAMAVSFPVVIAAVLAVAMIVLILIARKALIVLLIVVAPLAFVAYLLPNTEQWFKKWAKLFSTLLLLFPIVGAIFGASALAAKIVATAAKDDPFLQLTAIFIATGPMFIVPGVLKGAINGIGTFGTKMQGWANKAGGNVGGAIKNKSQLGQTFKAASEYRNQQKLAHLAKGRGRGMSAIVGRVAGGSGYNRKAQLRASDLEAAEFEDDVKSATNSISPSDHPDTIAVAQTGKKLDGSAVSEAEQVAAIRYAAKSGGASDVAKIDTVGKSARVKSATIEAFREKRLNNIVGNQVFEQIGKAGPDGGTNGAMIDDLVVKAANAGSIAATTIAQSDSTPAFIAGAIQRSKADASATQMTSKGYQNMQKSVDEAYAAPGTRSSMTSKMGEDLQSIGLKTP